MLKKIITAVLAAMFLLVGCSQTQGSSQESSSKSNSSASSESSSETSSEDTGDDEYYELLYLTNHIGNDANAQGLADTVERFNEENEGKIKINVDGMPTWAEYFNKLKVSIASGQVIDIFLYYDLPSYSGFWLEGSVADLTPYIDEEMYSYDTEEDWEACSADGKIYGVPYTMYYNNIFYNKEIFEQLGLPNNFETWEEFFDACETIKAAGITPLSQQTGGGDAWVTLCFFNAYVGSCMGNDLWANAVEQKDFNLDPCIIEAADMIKYIWDQGYTTSDALNGDYDIAANHFVQGRTAMIANGPWMGATFKETPGFYEKVGIMAYPGVSGENGQVIGGGPVGKLSTSKANESDTGRMEAIMKYLKYDNNPEIVKEKTIKSGSFYASTGLEFTDEDGLEPLTIEYFNYIGKYPTVNNPNDIFGPTFQTAFVEESSELWLGNITSEEFVTNLTQKTFNG